jgi:hypothetical protein
MVLQLGLFPLKETAEAGRIASDVQTKLKRDGRWDRESSLIIVQFASLTRTTMPRSDGRLRKDGRFLKIEMRTGGEKGMLGLQKDFALLNKNTE